jgi:hypothetical protein
VKTGLSCRWVFLINVPIGAVLIAVAVVSMAATRPGLREPSSHGRVLEASSHEPFGGTAWRPSYRP